MTKHDDCGDPGCCPDNPAMTSEQELVEKVKCRLPSIRRTIEMLLANGELADYDDEMANDLRYALNYLEAIPLIAARERQAMASSIETAIMGVSDVRAVVENWVKAIRSRQGEG